MRRLSARQYQRQVAVTMALYVAAMLVVWPMAKAAPDLWEKAALTLVPALPMLYVVGLMAWKIATSDELEQRTHLIALGAATAITASSSLVGGLLATSGALRLDGTILLWVFPVIMFSYGITHWLVTRRYGGSFGCDDAQGGATPLYLLAVAALLAIATLVGWWRGRMDDFTLGLMSGTVVGFVVLAAVVAWHRWRRRRADALAEASE